MSDPANCQLVGRWRIVEADLWNRAYLDLCGPALITITNHGRPVAVLSPAQATPRTFGQLPNLLVPNTFDDPLPDDELVAWEPAS